MSPEECRGWFSMINGSDLIWGLLIIFWTICMTRHGYARALAVWARNPAGFTWDQVKPQFVPDDVEKVREWAHQHCRDAGIMGDALDDALDRIDNVLLENVNVSSL